MLSIGQTEALPLLEQKNLTWPKLKNAHESEVLNAGLPKRLAAAMIEGLKADASTKLYALANRPRVVVNLDARSVEIDYEAVADGDLPPLPREAPPMSSRIEYKNYMRLRYEHQRRGFLEAVSPRGSARAGAGPAPPSPTMLEGPKSPRKRPQRAAPPPPADVPAYDVVVQARKSGAPPAEKTAEKEAPPVSPTVPPKPTLPKKDEQPKKAAAAKKEEPQRAAPEDSQEKVSPNPQRLTEMFATMEAKLNLQAQMKAEAQKEAAKTQRDEPKKEPKKKEEEPKVADTNLSEMLDEIEEEAADLDEVLNPKDDAAALRKSHLEQLSEVLADADEFDVGPPLRDSFFDSAVEPKHEDHSETDEDESEKTELPVPKKPLPRETDASEVYADVPIPQRGSQIEEASEAELSQVAKEESESSDEEASLPIVLASGAENDSELPSLPPVVSSSDEE